MQQHPQQQQNMKEPKSEKTIFFENALYVCVDLSGDAF